jgi:hypothetical protein
MLTDAQAARLRELTEIYDRAVKKRFDATSTNNESRANGEGLART